MGGMEERVELCGIVVYQQVMVIGGNGNGKKAFILIDNDSKKC